MATEITVEIGRHTIDPQGLGSDEDVSECTDYVLQYVRDAFPGADVRAVGNGGRTSGLSDDGEDLTREVRQIVRAAYDAWCSL